MPKRPKGLEAARILSRYALNTYWCPNCNVPIIGKEVCPRCGSECWCIPLSLPRDVRPAYEADVKEILRAIGTTYGVEVARRLMPYEGLYLLNKIQHYEAADEVISGGYVIGIRYFDTISRRWLFRPDKHGAMVIIEESLPGSALCRTKVSEGVLVSRSDIKIIEEPTDLAEWLVLKDSRGRVGIAKFVSSGKLRISKVYNKNVFRVPEKIKGSSFSLVAQVNRPIVEELEDEATKFLSENIGKFGGKPLIMLSGGKDSTVTAYIAANVGVRDAVFLDTGIEHKDTIVQVNKLKNMLDLNMIEVNAGNSFWKFLKYFGPPARDYRWCTRLIKLAILAKEFKRLGINKVISITGQRALESPSRALASRVAPTGPPNPDGVMLAPIHGWNSLLEHIFIYLKSLPLHPLYTLGFERIGCFLCPSSRLPELNVVSKIEPDLWNKWLSFLGNYSRRLGLPEIWVKAALWRWRFSYPGDLASKLRSHGYKPEELLHKSLGRIATVDTSSSEVALLEVKYVDLPRLNSLSKILNYKSKFKDEYLELSKGRYLFTIDSRGFIKVLRGGLEALSDAVALTYMSSECVGSECFLCTYICRYNAIKTGKYPIVDTALCVSCKNCLRICPVVLKSRSVIVLVKKLLS